MHCLRLVKSQNLPIFAHLISKYMQLVLAAETKILKPVKKVQGI
jgi:hypothetical protein